MLTWVDSFLSVHGNGIDVQVQVWMLLGLQTQLPYMAMAYC